MLLQKQLLEFVNNSLFLSASQTSFSKTNSFTRRALATASFLNSSEAFASGYREAMEYPSNRFIFVDSDSNDLSAERQDSNKAVNLDWSENEIPFSCR